jgi:hypothetical protein
MWHWCLGNGVACVAVGRFDFLLVAVEYLSYRVDYPLEKSNEMKVAIVMDKKAIHFEPTSRYFLQNAINIYLTTESHLQKNLTQSRDGSEFSLLNL